MTDLQQQRPPVAPKSTGQLVGSLIVGAIVVLLTLMVIGFLAHHGGGGSPASVPSCPPGQFWAYNYNSCMPV